jgi:hypothetical protein
MIDDNDDADDAGDAKSMTTMMPTMPSMPTPVGTITVGITLNVGWAMVSGSSIRASWVATIWG